MSKIKIISDWDKYAVEKQVNEFIANNKVTSLQFQMSGNSTSGKIYSVMIVYGG